MCVRYCTVSDRKSAMLELSECFFFQENGVRELVPRH
jgi:hypothetical protein